MHIKYPPIRINADNKNKAWIHRQKGISSKSLAANFKNKYKSTHIHTSCIKNINIVKSQNKERQVTSTMSTPGIIGLSGKWPGKKLSFIVTFLMATAETPALYSITLSTRRNGNLQIHQPNKTQIRIRRCLFLLLNAELD